MSDKDSTEIYRLRGIDKILGVKYQELERQTIFFAPPDDLNDPMEGFRDMFWQGDFIVWRNLFNHYLLCLNRLCISYITNGEEYEITENCMPIFHGEGDFPTPEYKDLFDTISLTFFAKKHITGCIQAISQRTTPVRRDELFSYLRMIHYDAIQVIFDGYKKKGLHENGVQIEKSLAENIITQVNAVEQLIKEGGDGERQADVFFEISKNYHEQIMLITRYNSKTTTKNKDLLLQDFPQKYLNQIEKLVFPNWYTAAFTTGYENSSSWGQYAGEHKGVCLIFDPVICRDKPSIALKQKNGFNSHSRPSYGLSDHSFYPITYKDIDAPIDFFRMLGRLPIPTLNAMWYVYDGEISECADEMNNSENEWRERYWERFYRDISVKSKDWEHENEQRLILAGMMIDFSDPEDRALAYDFKFLKGIIFGIKTKIEDKLKIMKIIEEKCKTENRTDFKFYQAHYSHKTGRITRSEMSLLRLSKESKQPSSSPE